MSELSDDVAQLARLLVDQPDAVAVTAQLIVSECAPDACGEYSQESVLSAALVRVQS